MARDTVDDLARHRAEPDCARTGLAVAQQQTIALNVLPLGGRAILDVAMIRRGFLDSEARQDLIELARDGLAAHRLARRANALVLLDGCARGNGLQDWTVGGKAPAASEHAEHDHAAMMESNSEMSDMDHSGKMNHAPTLPLVTLSEMVRVARQEQLAFPAIVTPPGAPGRFGRKGDGNWSVRSDSQNRPLRTTLAFDPNTGQELSRETFADGHPIDRIVGYGVAWHEGQLFG